MQQKKETEVKSGEGGIQTVVRDFVHTLVGDKENANARLIGIIAGIAFGIAAYFFGKCDMLFSSFPLGIALLCAADRHVPWIYAGLCFSASQTGLNTAVCVCTYSVVIAIRVFAKLALDSAHQTKKSSDISGNAAYGERIALVLKEKYREMFTESVYLRMACAAFGAFCLSLYALIVGGFRYYDLFGTFFSVVMSASSVFVFASYFDDELKGSRLRDFGVLGILTALSYATREITVFGVYVGAFVAFFATLCVCRRRGILSGCAVGLCLGLAFNPIYAPLFILEAAAAGVLWNISALAAATAGCVVGMIWGVYVNGFEALSQLLPALLCGAMVFGAADRLSLITSSPELIKAKNSDRAVLEALVREQINNTDESCMKRLSVMFSELAEAFYNLSDRLRRPGTLDLRRMCDGVFDRHCENCARRELCWGVEYSATLEVLNRLTADMHMKARADMDSVPEYLKLRCELLPQIIDEINESCASLTSHALMCDRTGVFALDYDGISRILSEALESGRMDYIIDDGSAETVEDILKKLRFSYDGVIAYGGRRKSIAVKGLDVSRAKISIKELRSALEDGIGIMLTEPIFTPVGSKFDMTVSTRRRFSIDENSYSLTSQGYEGVANACGDTYSSFENSADYYYMLISDGMGAGKEAAFTSRICAMFLEKMLTANNRSETSLRLLNSFMSERDGSARYECSATVDLLEFDMLGGNMSIIKSGAAPTYVKRGDNCFKLQSKNLPLGIIDTPDFQRIGFEIEDGDYVIMVSDGVTQSRDDCPWLLSMLNEEWNGDGARMAKRIAERARALGSDDDITVSVIRVNEISD